MAGLASLGPERGTPVSNKVEVPVAFDAPDALEQIKSIGWVRWRQFVNTFFRKGTKGMGEVIARLILYGFVAVATIGPITGAGFAGYFSIRNNTPGLLTIVTWVVLAIWIVIVLSTTLQPPTVDLGLLLRFPVRFRTFLAIRLLFGLMSMPNVVGSLILASAAIGVGIARPGLFPWALLTLESYALTVILLLRTAMLWLDRWLAQRRTREIFGTLFALFFLSFQFLNYWFQGRIANHGRHNADPTASLDRWKTAWHAVEPVARWLPPSQSANSIRFMNTGAIFAALGSLAAVLAFASLFLGLFAYRLQGEFRGENFNESAAGRAAARRSTRPKATSSLVRDDSRAAAGWLDGPIAACMRKEVRYLLRVPASLLGLAMPLVVMAIYSQRMRGFEWLLPASLAYALFGLLPTLYNVFGQDAEGAQLYLLSPTPLRKVFLAKNIVSMGLILLVCGLGALIVTRGQLPSAPVTAATALWFVFVVFTNLSFGNYRSLAAPMRLQLGKVQRRQGVSQLSLFMAMGVIFGSLLIGFISILVARSIDLIWIAPAMFLVLAAAAVVAYILLLGRIEQIAMAKRDRLIEVLCKS